MKNLKFIYLILLAISCKAQYNIVDETTWNGVITPNLYLMDVSDNLNAFTGTYVSTSNDTIFTIKLRKILMEDIGPLTRDMLIGELEFKIGNNILLNTMSNFNVNFSNQTNHNLDGGRTLDNTDRPFCTNCVSNEKRLDLSINDTKFVSSFILKRTVINGNSALLAYKFTQGPHTRHVGDPPRIPIIRDGNFVFIKQP